MTRALRAIGIALPIAVVAIAVHLTQGTTAWLTPCVLVVSALVAAGALVTAALSPAAAPRAHVGLAVGLLAAQVVILGLRLARVQIVAVDLMPDARLAVAVGVALLIAIYGLVRGRAWGRGFGIALGAVATVSGGLNLVNLWQASGPPTADVLPYPEWIASMHVQAWALTVTAIGGLTIVVHLAAPALRERFARGAEPWASSHDALRWVRPMIVTAFAAVPMLLVYAWLQPIVPATQTTALVLAVALAAGTALAVRGKLVGALVLVGAGAGLVAQTVATALGCAPDQHGVAGYYAVFWLPAAIVALACGARMARPVWRLLRA